MKGLMEKMIKGFLNRINGVLAIIFADTKVKRGTIVRYLRKMGWNYSLSQKEFRGHTVGRIYYFGSSRREKENWTADQILCRIKGGNTVFNLRILLHPEFIDFVIFDYIKGLSFAYNKNDILEILLELNISIENLGSFGYDNATDCVTLRLTYPALGSKITFRQFWQCLTNLLTTADKYYPEIRMMFPEIREKGTEGHERNVNP